MAAARHQLKCRVMHPSAAVEGAGDLSEADIAPAAGCCTASHTAQTCPEHPAALPPASTSQHAELPGLTAHVHTPRT